MFKLGNRQKKKLDLSTYLKNLVEKSSDVFWIKNADYSQQLYVSPAYETIWGRSREELYHNSINWIETIFIEDRESLQKNLRARNPQVKPGQKFFECYRIIRPNNEIRWIEDESFAIFDDEYNHIGFAGIAKDVSEKKQFKITELAKAEFIVNMSHDVKTPLSGIIALAEILKSRLQNKKELSFVNDIYLSGQRLMNFFENCLELSESEGNEKKILEEPFNLKILLNEISELFQPSVQEKQLFLKINYHSDVAEEFLGARAYLYRIMTNLLGNALKFTHQGGVTLHIESAEKSTAQQPIIKLIVEDTGIGIAKDKQEIIFERFSRVTPSYLGTYKGTGIGLYIVRKFVQTMGGEIYTKSEEGIGSCFTVILPLKIPSKALTQLQETQQTAVKKHRAQSNVINETPTAQKLSKILVVEDDSIAQAVAKIMLSPFSQEIDIASCGKEALEFFQPGKYGLIIVDLGLPDMEGDSLAKQMRTLELGSEHCVPIIALTAHTSEKIKDKCLTNGIHDTLSKPLSEEKIRDIIRRHVV